MASKSKVTTPVSQPDIANYIQRQRKNSNKWLLSSPSDNQPHKKTIIEVTPEVKDNQQADRLVNLPPNLKLLYDSLSVHLDSIDRKIDPNLSSASRTSGNKTTQNRRLDSSKLKKKMRNSNSWLSEY